MAINLKGLDAGVSWRYSDESILYIKGSNFLINISVIQKLSEAVKFKKGSVISTGVHCTDMHIILKGQVGIYSIDQNTGKKMLASFGPGDFFNEEALISDENLSTASVALTDVIALPISKNNAVSFIKNEPEMAYELIKELCRRLKKTDYIYNSSDIDSDFQINAEMSDLQEQDEIILSEADGNEKESGVSIETEEQVMPSSLPNDSKSAYTAFDANDQVSTADSKIAEQKIISLFPQGHGHYQLPLHINDKLYEKSYNCPLCKKTFKALQVKMSKLVVAQTDPDMRVRYKDVEPLYFDVVTCPHCLYSALNDIFDSPDKLKPELLNDLEAMKPEAPITHGIGIDTFSVFAGYYLALFCAPRCFLKHSLVTAKLLLKLSRIYQDCSDEFMEMGTTKQSLDAYMGFYQNENTDMKQEQQLCIIIAELCFKLNDLKTAKNFFFKAKTNRYGTPIMQNHAESRLFDIREIEKK